MGSWGYGIFEDDFPLDIKDLFDSFITEGVSTDQAIARLLRMFSDKLMMRTMAHYFILRCLLF
jgi:hypothetical protein